MFFLLVLSLEEHERDCAEEIFKSHGKLIYKIAYNILNNHHDAEDVLNDVMISIVKNIEKFLHSNENETISQIVIYSRNAAINVYNKNKRRKKSEFSFDDTEEGKQVFELADVFDLENTVISRQEFEDMQRHIKNLPDEYRDVISLVYNFGYSNVEAARILDITPNAVGLRLFKAKKKLLELMGGEK